MELDNLIFDRTQADVDRAAYLSRLWVDGTFTGTTAELAEWASDLKGAYNASDLNRVCAAVDYLTGVLTGLGYSVTTTLPEKKPVYTAKEIEYIESTGTQYIDTGFKPNQDTRVIIKSSVHVSNVANWLFGARTANGSSQYAFLGASAGYFRTDYAAYQTPFPASFNTDDPITIDKNKNVTTIKELGATQTVNYTTFQPSVNLHLFAISTNGSISTGNVSIYSCQIYDNGTLVRDFKPYYDPNGIPCLYDTVSRSYFYNSGTGSFIASEPPTTENVYWVETDIPQQAQMDVYINNIQLLRDCLPYVAPDAPDAPENLTYEQANNIEEILYRLENVLLAMQENFELRQANTFFMTAGGVFNNA